MRIKQQVRQLRFHPRAFVLLPFHGCHPASRR
jgi:hypothetical protein